MDPVEEKMVSAIIALLSPRGAYLFVCLGGGFNRERGLSERGAYF